MDRHCLMCGVPMKDNHREHLVVDSSDGEHSVIMPVVVVWHGPPHCGYWKDRETRIKCVTPMSETRMAVVNGGSSGR